MYENGEDEVEDRGDELTPEISKLEGAAAENAARAGASADAAKLAALQEGQLESETKKPGEPGETDELPETPEEKAEREAAEARRAAAANARIPKHRVDEMVGKANARAEAALAEVAALKAQLAAATKPTVDELDTLKKEIDQLQNQYEDHIIDGRKAEAHAVRQQLDAKREALMEQRIAQRANATREQTIAQLTYDAELARMEARFPQINPDSESYDPEVEKELGSLMGAFIAAGSTHVEALHKAIRYVMPKPTAPPPPAAKPPGADVAQARAAAAKAKAAAAVTKQPPDVSTLGKDSDKVGAAGTPKADVFRMSQKEFAALDDVTLRKLRGDEVE